MTTLNDARFYVNTMTGTIPVGVGLLTQMTYLDFGDNLLTHTLPSELGLLTLLTVLYSDDNLLTGTIPSELGALQELLLFQVSLTAACMPLTLTRHRHLTAVLCTVPLHCRCV